MKLVYGRIIFLGFIISCFSCLGFDVVMPKEKISYQSLLQPVAYLKDGNLVLSFGYIGSYLDVVDYILVEEKTPTGKKILITLLGKHYSNNPPQNISIKRVDDHYELVIKSIFTSGKDIFIYKYNGDEHIIDVKSL